MESVAGSWLATDFSAFSSAACCSVMAGAGVAKWVSRRRHGIGCMVWEAQTNTSEDSAGSPEIHLHATLVSASVTWGKSAHYGF